MLWSLALVAGTALFHGLGDGPLAPPPLDPATWSGWAQGRDPLVATIAVLRLVALALSWYLVGATTIGIVARTARAARLVRIADALTVPALRRLLQGALGMSLATAMVTAAVPPSAFTGPQAATVTLRAADAGSEAADADPVTDPGAVVRLSAPGEVADGAIPGDAEGRRPLPLELSDRGASAARAGDGDPAPDPGPVETPATAPASETPDDGEHHVVGGDSFWTIARDAVAGVAGPEPDDTRIHAYWRRLIDANRDRLADPDNPDLIFPGQRLVLPPPNGAGA